MEFGHLQTSGLVGRHCVVVADHVLRPGSPRLLWSLCYRPGTVELVSLATSGELEDWVAIGYSDDSTIDASATAGNIKYATKLPADFAALVAESEFLWSLATMS